jgi:hypothetical protein
LGEKWSVNLACDSDFHVNHRVLLHATNLRPGTDGFTSPLKEEQSVTQCTETQKTTLNISGSLKPTSTEKPPNKYTKVQEDNQSKHGLCLIHIIGGRAHAHTHTKVGNELKQILVLFKHALTQKCHVSGAESKELILV